MLEYPSIVGVDLDSSLSDWGILVAKQNSGDRSPAERVSAVNLVNGPDTQHNHENEFDS